MILELYDFTNYKCSLVFADDFSVFDVVIHSEWIKKQDKSLLNYDDTIFTGFTCLSLIQDFREKNTDHMRPDIVALLKSSKNAFICGLMGIDPVATFRWAVLRAYFRALVAFREAGRRHTHKKTGEERSSGLERGSGLKVQDPENLHSQSHDSHMKGFALSLCFNHCK